LTFYDLTSPIAMVLKVSQGACFSSTSSRSYYST
jgi:hypothetical protein